MNTMYWFAESYLQNFSIFLSVLKSSEKYHCLERF